MAEIGYDMERGYVKLWRKTLDSGLLQSPTAWQVFGWLLLSASRKKHVMIVGGAPVVLGEGDVCVSRSKLAASLELSEQQVRTALNLLKKLEIITIKATNKTSIISLINWSSYQDVSPAEQPASPQQNNQCLTSGQPAPNQPFKEQEIKNINIPPTLSSLRSESVSPTGNPAPTAEKPKRSSSASVSRKPPTPDEVRAYCDERGNGINAERFCDYYAAQGWKLSNGQPLKDWKAAVRTWESREKERQTQVQHIPRATTVAQQRQQERQIQARMLLADREQRRQTEERNAQGQRYVTDSDGTKLALPPGW